MPADAAWIARVERIVHATPVHDLHTHLYDPAFGSLLLWGIDELLVYHYLVSESFRHLTVPYDTFWAADRATQAQWIWDALFVEHTPVSEACRGVLTVLHSLGLEPRRHDLPSLRRWFAAQEPGAYVERVLSTARVASVCMTNSPFDPEERPGWEQGFTRDPRFRAALRIDPLLLNWQGIVPQLRAWGYAVTGERNVANADAVRRFLADWTRRIGSRYCMVSLPPDFAYPTDSDTAWLLEHAVLPHGRDHGQALALMLGVKRAVNPALRLAGDGVGRSDLGALQALCAGFPANRFLATCLSRENQHELVVLARKFRNLHPFGCWWFTNTPQLIAEITTLRLELLGTSFTPQHSDARVLDQLVYKWSHSRTLIARCLADRYADLAASGWEVTEEEIARDARELLGGAAETFLKNA
jgi:hypothetical protein